MARCPHSDIRQTPHLLRYHLLGVLCWLYPTPELVQGSYIEESGLLYANAHSVTAARFAEEPGPAGRMTGGALHEVQAEVAGQMHISRENALLGNYKASLVYFDGVIAQIQRNLRPVCLLYTSPSPRDLSTSRMPSSA